MSDDSSNSASKMKVLFKETQFFKTLRTSTHIYKVPTMKPQTVSKPSFSVEDEIAKRIIAPYVTIPRAGKKDTLRRDPKYLNFFVTEKSIMLMQSLKNYVAIKNDIPSWLYDTANDMRILTDSLGVRLYFIDRGRDQLYQYQKNVTYSRCRVNFDLNTCNSVACYVAKTMEYVMINNVHKDLRFPDGISYKENVMPVLCVPIVTTKFCYAVIELYRHMSQAPYSKNDLKMAVVMSGWIGLTIDEIKERYLVYKKQAVSTDLMQMVMTYYGEPETLETLLSTILNYTKKEVKAEKGTIYVITDVENLLADVYEEGISDFSRYVVKKKRAVSFGEDNTVARFVAQTKKKMSVKNLSTDSRFKSQVNFEDDLMIIQRTEVCVPIMCNKVLLGLISMVNKNDGEYFKCEDEEIMEEIAIYTGLALFYAQARRQINHAEMQCVHSSELLEFHLKPSPIEMDVIKLETELSLPKNIDNFNYYIKADDLTAMPLFIIRMLRAIVPDDQIFFEDLYAFVLTVQRSYRQIPFHNFEHAFIAMQAIYTILIRNMDLFTLLEREALMIAALTHDIDHYGVTNSFLLNTNHYLSELYEDTILENHHFAVTEHLLKKYKLFKNITDDNEKTFLQEIRENIIFTELGTYFKNRGHLSRILAKEKFNIYEPFHKYLTRSVCMTIADLTTQTKSFNISKKLTDTLYSEFFTEGDCLKEMGYTPLPMFDRNWTHYIPNNQWYFVTVVAMSCADLLRQTLPNTEELYNNAEMLQDTWRTILDSRNEKLWRQCDSLVM